MTNTHITLIDVRNYINDHEVDISGIDGNPTLLGGIAKEIARGLNGGKSPKQVIERVQGFIVNVWGEQKGAEIGKTLGEETGVATEEDGFDAEGNMPGFGGRDNDEPSDFDGSLDDLTDENTAGQAALGDALDAEEDSEDDQPSDPEQPSEEASEEESEEGVDKSVVKGKYRSEYKARGNARNCGDWFARISDGFLLAKKKLDIVAWEQICELNGCKELFAKYTTAEKQLNNGWQGRARMSVGLCVRVNAARNNGLELPKELYNRMAAKLDADNKRFRDTGKPERVVDWKVFEDLDTTVMICPVEGTPDQHFFADVVRKHGENNKTLAEGRKKAKAGEPARASEEGQGE